MNTEYYNLLVDFQQSSIDPLSDTQATEKEITSIIRKLPDWCSKELHQAYRSFKAEFLKPENSEKIFAEIDKIKTIALRDIAKEAALRSDPNAKQINTKESANLNKAPTQPVGAPPLSPKKSRQSFKEAQAKMKSHPSLPPLKE